MFKLDQVNCLIHQATTSYPTRRREKARAKLAQNGIVEYTRPEPIISVNSPELEAQIIAEGAYNVAA